MRKPHLEVHRLAAGLGVVFCLASALGGEEPLPVGNRRQLLMDDRFAQQARGIEFVVHAPVKTGDRTIVSEPGLALGGYHSVLFDGGVYHLWYMAGAWVLYARSGDGIHWEKPEMNLLPGAADQGTSAPPNAVMGRGLGGVSGGMHGLMVFLDPKTDASARFRLVANPPEFDTQLQIFSSPDGLHWKHTFTNVITFNSAVKPHHLDSQNVIFWDDPIQSYVAYFRKNMREPGSQGRTVARCESTNLSFFAKVDDCPVVLQADPDHVVHSGATNRERIALLDVYTSGTIRYPWAEDAYLMFPTEYYHYGGQIAEFRKEAPVNAGVLDTCFASSRDGIKWQRYDHRPFVGLGMRGEFDSKRIYMVYGMVPALNDRELYMYYLGTSATHGWDRNDQNNRLLTAADVGPTGPAIISRVVLRRDGFVSARAAFGGGEFTTPLLRFAGDQLLLNVDTSACGELRVELLDEQGQPVPNHSLRDCDLVHTTNEISRVVKWKGESSVKALAGKPLRLHFVMRDLDLTRSSSPTAAGFRVSGTQDSLRALCEASLIFTTRRASGNELGVRLNAPRHAPCKTPASLPGAVPGVVGVGQRRPAGLL